MTPRGITRDNRMMWIWMVGFKRVKRAKATKEPNVPGATGR